MNEVIKLGEQSVRSDSRAGWIRVSARQAPRALACSSRSSIGERKEEHPRYLLVNYISII